MIASLLLIFLTLFSTQTLAPPPINFEKEIIDTPEGKFEVTYTTKGLKIHELPRLVKLIENNHWSNEPPEDPEEELEEHDGAGCFLLLITAALFWVGIFCFGFGEFWTGFKYVFASFLLPFLYFGIRRFHV